MTKELYAIVETIAKPLLTSALKISEKKKREDALAEINTAVYKVVFPEGEEPKYSLVNVNYVIKEFSSKMMRRMILDRKYVLMVEILRKSDLLISNKRTPT